MILVVGATGLLGGEVCRRLAGEGKRVRALVRTTSAPEKVAELRALGVELCVGDLKDPASLAAACEGVDAVISTASSTLSRQAGDSIESVDGVGQLSLVKAAKAAGVDRFVFVSFQHSPQMPFPLAEAKAAVEEAIAGMNYTVIQAGFFMEVWLSPVLGFDYVNGTARVCGDGNGPASWVSYKDVAAMCVAALGSSLADRKVIVFGGPERLSILQVVDIFQAATGKTFELQRVPLEVLHDQFAKATDPLEKSFGALMLGFAYGDAMQVDPVVDALGIRLATVGEYARAVAGA